MKRSLLLLLVVTSCAAQRPKPLRPPMPDLDAKVAPRSMADEAARAKAPFADGATVFTPPIPIERRLSNGIRVLVLERHDIPLVAIRIVSDRGADQADRGIPEVYGQTVLRASTDRPSWQVSDDWNDLGGRFGAHIGNDATVVEIEVLAKLFDATMDLISDVMVRPAFPDKIIEHARQRLRSRINLEIEHADVQRDLAVRETFYPSTHPYSKPLPPLENVQKVDEKLLLAYHQHAFTPAHTTVIVVGDVVVDTAVATLERALGKLAGATVGPQAPPGDAPIDPGPPSLVFVEWAGGSQSHLSFAWRGATSGAEDRAALRVAESEIGARAFWRLRQELGITYGVHVRNPLSRGRLPFEILTSVEMTHTGQAITEMMKIVTDLAAKPLRGEYLAECKTARKALIADAFQTLADTGQAFGSLAVYGRPLDWYARWATEIGAVSGDQVQQSVLHHLPLAKMRVIVLAPQSALEQIEPIVKENGWRFQRAAIQVAK